MHVSMYMYIHIHLDLDKKIDVCVCAFVYGVNPDVYPTFLTHARLLSTPLKT